MNFRALATICILVIALPALAGSADDEAKTGVYEYVVRQSSLDFDAASVALEKQIAEGPDSSRKKLACPGIAHTAAYPLEVVVAVGDNGVEVKMVEAMYRMKMFFEDAGKWAFMKNMGMPGSIAEELQERVGG